MKPRFPFSPTLFFVFLLLFGVLGATPEALSAPLSLVSINNAGTDSGNAASANQVDISADGSAVTFESQANDLVLTDGNGVTDIFVRDLLSGVTTLVSINGGGTDSANQGGSLPSISDDGSAVAFQSGSTDLVGITDNNGTSDVFVRDLVGGTTTLVSVNAAGNATGNGTSHHGFLGGDNHLVLFNSAATDLVATTDNNGAEDLFLRDLTGNTTTLVSVNSAGTAAGNGESFGSEITPDGRFVLFESDADDLTSTPDGNGTFDVFVRDLVAGTTTLISLNNAGTAAGNMGSFSAQITPDGRFVVFTSDATDLTTLSDNNNDTDVFVRDLVAGTTTLVSVNSAGTAAGNFASSSPIISHDGRFVAFDGNATDLVTTPDNNNQLDVFVRDLTAGTTTLISLNSAGTAAGNDGSGLQDFSADGGVVGFESDATDIASTDNNGARDVFVRDLTTGTTTLLSINNTGTDTGNAGSDEPHMSSNGDRIVFRSDAGDLATQDTNGVQDLFLAVRTGQLQFSSATYSVDENGGTATITVTRTGGSGGAVSVDFATSDGSATAGADYTSNSGILDFADGETVKTFTIPILEDTLVEGDETVNLTLSNPTNGATLGTPSQAILTLVEGGEVCDNGIDDNGDGAVDCADPACATDPSCDLEVSGSGCALGTGGGSKGYSALFLFPFLAMVAMALRGRRSEKKI